MSLPRVAKHLRGPVIQHSYHEELLSWDVAMVTQRLLNILGLLITIDGLKGVAYTHNRRSTGVTGFVVSDILGGRRVDGKPF